MTTKFESALNELDDLIKDPLFYQNENESTLATLKTKIKSLIVSLREGIPELFEKLTSENGEKLPEWVYKVVIGGMDEFLAFIDEKLENETNSVRKVAIEILKNVVTQFRARVREVGEFIQIERNNKKSSSSS